MMDIYIDFAIGWLRQGEEDYAWYARMDCECYVMLIQ